MSELAAFLKSKVDESLTTLVQPAGLVPATLFVLLNLGFVYPLLKDELGFVGAFGDLEEMWQAVIVAALILFLGYLLLSSTSSVLDILAGESWRHSWFYGYLRDRQHRQAGHRVKQAAQLPTERDKTAARWDFRVSYALQPDFSDADADPLEADEAAKQRAAQLEDVGPTALGNVLSASRLLIHDRYGIDPTSLWPPMETVLPKDGPVRATVTDAKSSLDTLANVAFVLVAFGVEAIVLHSVYSSWMAVLLSSLALPVGYVAYRAAVAKARAYGDAMEVAFDLHRSDLHEKLKLRDFVSPSDERKMWRKVSSIFLWGRKDVDEPDDIYKPLPAAAPASASITSSKNLDVARHRESAVDIPGLAAPGSVRGRYVEYELVITRTSQTAAEGFIALADKRVPQIAAIPEFRLLPPKASAPEASIEPGLGGTTDTLVVRLPTVAEGSSLWLSFVLPIWEFAAPGLIIGDAKRDEKRLVWIVHVEGGKRPRGQRLLRVFVGETPLTPTALVRGQKLPPEGSAPRFSFDLTTVKLPAEVRLVFTPGPAP